MSETEGVAGGGSGKGSVLASPEFWMTVLTSLTGVLLALGAITREQREGIDALVPQVVGSLLSLLSLFKFVGTRHAARVEVFRAMCAMRLAERERASGGDASALSVRPADETRREVAAFARAAGL